MLEDGLIEFVAVEARDNRRLRPAALCCSGCKKFRGNDINVVGITATRRNRNILELGVKGDA